MKLTAQRTELAPVTVCIVKGSDSFEDGKACSRSRMSPCVSCGKKFFRPSATVSPLASVSFVVELFLLSVLYPASCIHWRSPNYDRHFLELALHKQDRGNVGNDLPVDYRRPQCIGRVVGRLRILCWSDRFDGRSTQTSKLDDRPAGRTSCPACELLEFLLAMQSAQRPGTRGRTRPLLLRRRKRVPVDALRDDPAEQVRFFLCYQMQLDG